VIQEKIIKKTPLKGRFIICVHNSYATFSSCVSSISTWPL
jgi:hypothetical protein